MIPLCCWDEQHRVLFVHAEDHGVTAHVDVAHLAPACVALVDPTPLHAEIAALRRDRAAKVERWLESRPVVGTVYQITAGVHAGRWDASCRGAHGVFRDHADAVRFADRMTRAEGLRDADQDWLEVAA